MSLPSSHSSLKIHEVMHPGIIDCPPQTLLGEVASLMAENSVHCVVVVVDGLARRRLEPRRGTSPRVGSTTVKLSTGYVVIPFATRDFLDWQDQRATITSEP